MQTNALIGMKQAELIDGEDPGHNASNSHPYRRSELKERISALDPLSLHTGPIDVHCMVQRLAPSCIDSRPELDNHRAHEMKRRSISNRSFRFEMHGV
jgi:hypothetical protein